ncbi:MAG: protein kinase, partial [Ignavibacteriota bacterium]
MKIWNLFKKKKNEHKKPTVVAKKLDLPQIKKYKIGDKIGGQYLVHQIFGGEGKSGMGVVYLVTSDKFDFPFVLKTYQKTSDLNQKRFVKEIETWVQLGYHPNIVRTFGAQWIDLQLYILAEYIQFNENGRNILTDYLKKDKISYENIIKWSVQFCYGMEHAVNCSLIAHRDIKPDNLMITSDLNLKITDFGLSKISDYTDIISHSSENKETNAHNYTKTDSFMGTALYVAPEQIRNSKDVDYRADIYSFGIILYQMISGGHWVYDIPKQSNDILGDLLKAHLSSKPNSLKSPFMPIIEKCLYKKKESRYQTFKELLNDLELLAKKLNISSPPNLFSSTQKTEELYVKASSYVKLGDNEKALHFINEYLTNQPQNHSALNLKGIILEKLNRIDEALACYNKAIEIYPY